MKNLKKILGFLKKVLFALEDSFIKGEQSLLFLNRRGYSPLTICHNCGHQISM